MTEKMEKITDWFALLNQNNLLCSEYNKKVINAKSKKQLMDLVLDANGSSYLQEMDSKGCGLPYEFICTQFAPYINGRYIAEYSNTNKSSYTSALYCCFSGEKINVDTTLCSVLGYSGTIVVKKNNFAKIYLDKNCNVTITLEDGARCVVEYWKGATVAHNLGDANTKRLQLIEH
jgi:cytochrome c oxidase assembly protein Cox11